MKKIFTLLFCISGITMEAQSWSYASVGENFSGYNTIMCSVKDDADNIYIAGVFQECYHCGNPNGMFVSKISPAGNVLWTDTVQNQPNYLRILVKSMYLKTDGSLSLNGYITDTINFMGHMLLRNDPVTGFFADFDASGNCLGASTLPYVPMRVIKNMDNTLSIVGETVVPVSDLTYLPSTGMFIGNFNDYHDANWIRDLSGTFSSTNNVPAMTSSPGNVIYLVSPTGVISKHDKITSTTLGNNYQETLYYIDDKLYGYAPISLATGIINVFDTAGVLLEQQFPGGFGTLQGFCKHASGFAIGGVFEDSLVYNGQTFFTDTTSGLYHMYVLEVDSNWDLQSFKIVDAEHGGGGCTIEPTYMISNGTDIFIQGYLGSTWVFDSDTLQGQCAGVSSFFYARMASGVNPGVTEQTTETDFSVYPNPSSGIFTIDIKNRSAETNICVYDVLGNCVLNRLLAKNDKQRIDLSNKPNGIYFVEMLSDGKRIVKKIVLN